MKKIFNVLVILVILLSACTLNVPDLFGVRIVNAAYQDLDNLAIYLRNAGDGYTVKVGDITFDCSFDENDPDLLVCVGPGLEPGEEQVIQFFEDGGGGEPVAELTFIVPDIPNEYKDSDSDGVPNAEDDCPADPLKSAPGVCGCGKVDTDSDGDGIPDCKDTYPSDPNNKESDQDETDDQDPDEKDTDEDGIPDEEDLCPEDPEKAEPGICGCGTPDADEDEDGLPDCEDECPGLAYQDTIGDPCNDDEDEDGIKDGGDQCPFDRYKFTPGYCGCGESEKDSDKDGYPDCVDQCPYNPDKIKPDEYGCDDICNPESIDTDGDGVPDCEDGCPTDKRKTEPGECGCCNQECPDCIDLCPEDPEKCEPGICGCGDWDDAVGDPCNHDEDGDGYNDYIDECPFDPEKKHPGECGCGDWEDPIGRPCNHDEDEDGFLDWEEDCPFSAEKTSPGDCGCGCPDTVDCLGEPNDDGDWFCDCWDVCPAEPGEREFFGCTEWPPPF